MFVGSDLGDVAREEIAGGAARGPVTRHPSRLGQGDLDVRGFACYFVKEAWWEVRRLSFAPSFDEGVDVLEPWVPVP